MIFHIIIFFSYSIMSLCDDVIEYILTFLVHCEMCRSTLCQDNPKRICSHCHRYWCRSCLQNNRVFTRIADKDVCLYCLHQERPILS